MFSDGSGASVSRSPGGEPVDVSDGELTITYAAGTQDVRLPAGAAPEHVEPNAVSFANRPGGERAHVGKDRRTITHLSGTKTTRP
ncbi:hypothetical protein ACIBI3_16420 [Actinomadura luteofluorescens]|uniref:hypothetical protein n=1 Tax=Actinomadura luteofluorescens TaxID=46163 RepID=UPI00348986AD